MDTLSNVQRNIAEHVAILAAAKHRAEDESIITNVHYGIFDIGPGAERVTLVAFACTKKITSDRVVLDVLKRTRHAEGATRHIDGAGAHNVGLLVAAINVGEDMATGNVDHGIAPHTPRRTPPNRLLVHFIPERIIARTTSKNVAIESMSIGGIKRTAVRVVTYRISVNIISIVIAVSISVWPMVTFVEGTGIVIGEGAVLDFINHRSPLLLGI